MLTQSQLEEFDKNGWLVLPDFLTPDTVSTLRRKLDDLLSDFDPSQHPGALFKTGDASQDDYFLSSNDKVRYFLEPDAVDPATGHLLVEKTHAVNKIGHALHELVPEFAAVSNEDGRVKSIARQLAMVDPVVLQSMAILKQPRVGGAVPPHQDSTFLYTHTPSAVGFWFALEDCTLTNGCLSFADGTHKTHPLTSRFVRKDGSTTMESLSQTTQQQKSDGHDTTEYKPATCKAGSLVLIHGSVLHKSEHNRSDRSRMIYTFHCVDLDKGYDERNWLQPGPRGFIRLYA